MQSACYYTYTVQFREIPMLSPISCTKILKSSSQRVQIEKFKFMSWKVSTFKLLYNQYIIRKCRKNLIKYTRQVEVSGIMYVGSKFIFKLKSLENETSVFCFTSETTLFLLCVCVYCLLCTLRPFG